MHDVLDIIKNVESIYDSNTSFQVLKDFERVLDELDIYVYDNWDDGELAAGPKIERHWVTCSFMWPKDKMPDPKGGKRLLDYDCKVRYQESSLIEPRKIKKPDDMRPGTKKGKLDRKPIWIVEIQMPKKLIMDIYSGYAEMLQKTTEPATPETVTPEPQTADATAAAPEEGAAV
jgi:hypothetical protein